MAVIQLEVPEHLVVTKKRQRNRRQHGKGQGTNRTVTPEVREWLNECVKNHWFFCQPFQQGKWDPRQYGDPNRLLINFFDPKDAALFKLTWI